VSEFVREEPGLVFYREITDPVGTTDFGSSNSCSKGHGDGFRGAEQHPPVKAHRSRETLDQPTRWPEATGFKQASEVEHRAAENEEREQ
jgi:hypothetical protein